LLLSEEIRWYGTMEECINAVVTGKWKKGRGIHVVGKIILEEKKGYRRLS